MIIQKKSTQHKFSVLPHNRMALLLCPLMALSMSSQAAKYYVNDNSNVGNVYTTSNGNDAHSGTASSPFLTINKGISVAAAGDTVYVDAGTYAEQVNASKKIVLLGANATISPN